MTYCSSNKLQQLQQQ